MAQEKSLQTLILDDLRSLRKYCEVFKIIKTSDNGEPDIFFTTALTKGVFVETKAPKKDPRKLQWVKIKKLNTCGTKAYACRTWEEWYKLKECLGLLDMGNIIKAHEQQQMLLSQ